MTTLINDKYKMNYLQIIIEGYGKESTREILDKYFIRKYKEASEKHFSSDEFFNGCMEVINSLYSEMDKRLWKRKNDIYFMMGWRKKGMKGSADTPKEPSEDDLNAVKEFESELATLSRQNFPVNLYHFGNRVYTGSLSENEVIYIHNAIIKAKRNELINKKASSESKLSLMKIEAAQLNPSPDNDRYFNKPYNGLFAVSEQKRLFKTPNGIKTIKVEEANEYDLLNFSIYDENTGEQYEVGEQYKYDKNFFSKLVELNPLEIDEFLNYHYLRTANKPHFEKHLNLTVLTKEHFENNNKAIKKAIEEWINKKTNSEEKEKNSGTQDNKENPYPEIFINYKAYALFVKLYDDYKESKNVLANFSFIYRQMHSEKLIKDYYRPEMFKEWISEEPFCIILGNGLKTLDRCLTDDKKINYDNSKTTIS